MCVGQAEGLYLGFGNRGDKVAEVQSGGGSREGKECGDFQAGTDNLGVRARPGAPLPGKEEARSSAARRSAPPEQIGRAHV